MGECLFPSSNDNALSVSQGRTEGHRWVKDAIPINRSVERLKVLLYQKPITRVGMAEMVKLEVRY